MNPLSLICLFGILLFEIFPAWNVKDIGTVRSLNAISMNQSGVGFIAGDSGFVLKSIDTGKTWKEINTGHPAFYMAVRVVSPTKVFVGGSVGVVILSDNGGQSWSKVNVPIRSTVDIQFEIIYNIFFRDTLEGYVLANFSPPLKTFDGGITWNDMSFNFSGDSTAAAVGFTAIGFPTSDTGYLANGGEVFKSLDGGNSWKLLARPGWPGFEEWNHVNLIYDFYFISSDTGFFISPYYSGLFKTTDGLNSMRRIGEMAPNAIHFANKKLGAIAGDEIHQTDDGGLSWQKALERDTLKGRTFYDIYFFSDSLAFAVGSGGLFAKFSPGGIGIEKKTDDKFKYPAKFAFRQNSPNPLNFFTRVMYDLPMAGGQYGQYYVSVSVYNTKGQKVRSLVNKSQQPGSYAIEWDGSNDSGTHLPAGEYLLKMKAGDFSATRKVVLLK